MNWEVMAEENHEDLSITYLKAENQSLDLLNTK
jgi:hypothetical protein